MIMILVKSGIGAKDDIGKLLAGMEVEGVENINAERCNDGTYEVSIKSRYDDDPNGKFSKAGFSAVTGTCDTCLHYGGAYTHDFMRGNIGDCFETGESYSPWYQCKHYASKKEAHDKLDAAIKKAEAVESLKNGIPLKRIGSSVEKNG